MTSAAALSGGNASADRPQSGPSNVRATVARVSVARISSAPSSSSIVMTRMVGTRSRIVPAGHLVEHTGSTAHADIDQFPDGVERLLIDLHYTFPVQSTCCTISERLSFFTGLFMTPVAPRARHLFFCGGLDIRGQDKDGDSDTCRFYLAEKCKTVKVGHEQVGNNQVGFLPDCGVQALAAVYGCKDRMTRPFEKGGEDPALE